MAGVGGITPGGRVTHVVPDRPATDEKEHQQHEDESGERKEPGEEEKNKREHENGIDIYV